MSQLQIAALADLHLGYQAYGASDNGRNARECDVERAFARVIQRLTQLRPHLVTFAGDVFHTRRPTMHALYAYRDGLRKLSDAGIPAVIIPGNHDCATSASTKSPILLPEDLPLIYCVTDHRTIRLELQGKQVAIRCAPHVNLLGDQETPVALPDPEADINLLLMHSAVKSAARPNALPYHYAGPHAPDIARIAGDFDAVLLGDYHEYTDLVPGQSVFYSGSIERTSSNSWIEKAPKGFVTVDPETPGSMQFHETESRPMFSLNLVTDLGEMPTAEVINQHMQDALADESVRGAILRLFVPGFPRSERDGIDRKLERQLKAHALHFQLDLRAETRGPAAPGGAALHAGRSLHDAARAHFGNYPTEVARAGLALLSIEGTPHDLDDPEALLPIPRKAS